MTDKKKIADDDLEKVAGGADRHSADFEKAPDPEATKSAQKRDFGGSVGDSKR